MICSHEDALPIAINLGTGDSIPKVDIMTEQESCQLRQVTRILQLSVKVNVSGGTSYS